MPLLSIPGKSRLKQVPLSDLREQYQHLSNIINIDRNCCISLRDHQHNASRALIVGEELEDMRCDRACIEDWDIVRRLLILTSDYIKSISNDPLNTIYMRILVGAELYQYLASNDLCTVTVYKDGTPYAQGVAEKDFYNVCFFDSKGIPYVTCIDRLTDACSDKDVAEWLVCSHPYTVMAKV